MQRATVACLGMAINTSRHFILLLIHGVLLLLVDEVLLETPDPGGCNCVSCKTISVGDHAGTYRISDDVTQQARCDGGCLYINTETGVELCMCDPGDVVYTLPDSCQGTICVDVF